MYDFIEVVGFVPWGTSKSKAKASFITKISIFVLHVVFVKISLK